MSRWIHNPAGRIIAVARDLPEKLSPGENSLKTNGGLVLVSALVVVIGLLTFWPTDDPATLSFASAVAIDNRSVSAATGTIYGERYLAVLTTNRTDLQQPALELFAVSDSGDLTPAGTLDSPLDALEPDLPSTPSIAFAGETVYLPLPQSRDPALWIVDVSDPESPKQLSVTPLETSPGSAAVDGDLAAVGPMDGTLTQFFDVEDPAAPELLGTFRHSIVSTGNIEMEGSTIYVSDRQGVSVVDITSLDDPRVVGRFEDETWASRLQHEPGHVTPRIAVEQDHLYAASDEYGVNVLDVAGEADPDAATRRLERNPGNLDSDRALDATASGEHLLILSERGAASEEPLELAYVVRDIDISNPGDPDVAAETEVIASPETGLVSVAVDDSFAYFLAGSTIHVIELSE
ncbi:MAG: hypothetical protein R3A46_04315 [Thermomicrobiales bacterium]